MRVDITALQRFYGSPLGAAARALVQRKLDAIWPDAAGLDVLGIGYAVPYLERLRGSARRVAAMMPAAQGAEPWPHDGAGTTCLSEETRLPFIDAVFDRVLIVHGLEEAENVQAFLREVWRVTAPEGRVIVAASNRTGFWARSDKTPFGYGRPWTRAQLAALLTDAMFTPIARARALYWPPAAWAARVSEAMEKSGSVLWPMFGGVVLMEAVKRLAVEPTARGRKVVPAIEAAKPARA